MFVLRTEHCLYKLYVTLFLFRGHIPQLYTQFDVDMLFHFMDSDGTIKHDAQNMFIQNNNEVSFHQSFRDCLGHKSHTLWYLWQPVMELYSCCVFLLYVTLISFSLHSLCSRQTLWKGSWRLCSIFWRSWVWFLVFIQIIPGEVFSCPYFLQPIAGVFI